MKLLLDSKKLRNIVNLAVVTTTDIHNPYEQECHLLVVNGQVYFYVGGKFTVCANLGDTDQPNGEIVSFLLPQFSRILTPFTDGQVTIISEGSKAKISAPKLSATLSTIVSETEIDYVFSFNSIAVVDTNEFKLSIKRIASLSQVGVTSFLGQQIAGTIQFYIDGNIFTLQATDGVKYGAVTITSNRLSDQSVFTLPTGTISRVASTFNPFTSGSTIISRKGPNLISIGNQDYFVTLPLFDTKFKVNPTQARQLLTSAHNALSCSTDELVDAIESAASLYKKIKDAKLDVKVELDISKYSFTVATCICPRLNLDTRIGSDRIIREVDFDIASEGWPDDITNLHFNADVLRSVVSAAAGERINLWFGKSYQPLVINPDDDDLDDIFVAMPLGNFAETTPPLRELANVKDENLPF